MNKETVEKLWGEISRMHGRLSMEEASRLIIYALLIRYIDINRDTMESYDEKYSLGYLALTYGQPGLVKPEDLAGYVRKIEEKFMPEGGVISEGLERLLAKAEPSHVQALFKTIIGMDLDGSRLYGAAASLLDTLAYTHGNGMGDIPPNLSLSRLEGRLLGCRAGMRVYDGFCGYGLSVNEAADGNGIVCMQDLDRDLVGAAAALAVLRGNQIEAVRCGNSLTNPLGNEKYDRIIIEPPFMSRYDSDIFLSVPDDNCVYPEIQDGGSLALRHALAHLGDDGVAIVLIPAGMLFKTGRPADVREKLVSAWLDAVIELPSGVIANTWTATALLVLKKKKKDDTIFMLNAKDFFERTGRNRMKISDENIKKLVGIYERREAVDGVSCNAAEEAVAGKGYNLCTTQYVISNPHSMIVPGDAAEYMAEYKKLAGELAELDTQLDAVRSRFIK